MKKPPDLEGFQEFCNIQKESKWNISYLQSDIIHLSSLIIELSVFCLFVIIYFRAILRCCIRLLFNEAYVK